MLAAPGSEDSVQGEGLRGVGAPLSRRLREGTRQAHRAVESLAFIRSFLRGVVDHESYLRMLVDLHQVYLQLESWLGDPSVPSQLRVLFPPELWRSFSLEQDQVYHTRKMNQGTEPCSACPPPSQSALAYARYLNQLRHRQPLLLLSHAYTRYLGDLSGGQILRRIAGRALGIRGKEGLLFYEFPAISDCESFKKDFRVQLDSLPLDEVTLERLVDEARLAFALNGTIYAELQGSAWGGFRNLFRGS